MGIRFLANQAEHFYDNSRDYYLSIGFKEFWFWAFITIFNVLGPKKERGPQKWVWDLKSENPTKKLAHLVDFYGI